MRTVCRWTTLLMYAAWCNGGHYAMCAVIDGPKNPAGPIVKKAAPAADVPTQDN